MHTLLHAHEHGMQVIFKHTKEGRRKSCFLSFFTTSGFITFSKTKKVPAVCSMERKEERNSRKSAWSRRAIRSPRSQCTAKPISLYLAYRFTSIAIMGLSAALLNIYAAVFTHGMKNNTQANGGEERVINSKTAGPPPAGHLSLRGRAINDNN